MWLISPGLWAVFIVYIATAAEVRIFRQYVGKALSGNNIVHVISKDVRKCMEECVVQGVNNLRSIDHYLPEEICWCQAVNKDDVPDDWMEDTAFLTYQYEETISDALLFVSDISRSTFKRVALTDRMGPTASVDYAVLIVAETGMPLTTETVTTRAQCQRLCMDDESCNAFILEGTSYPKLCSTYNNLDGLTT